MRGLICQILWLYLIVIFISIGLSWFPTRHGSGLHQVRMTLGRVTDPVMVPVRRALGISFGGIDFSPIVVILGINILMRMVC